MRGLICYFFGHDWKAYHIIHKETKAKNETIFYDECNRCFEHRSFKSITEWKYNNER